MLMIMLVPEHDNQMYFLSRRVPDNSGCHDFRIGVQEKRLTQKDKIPRPTIKPMRHHKAIFLLPPVNTRRYRRARDSLARVVERMWIQMLTKMR